MNEFSKGAGKGMYSKKNKLIFTLITAFILFSTAPKACSVTELGDDFNNFSNASAYLLPALAFGLTVIKTDKPGTVQFVKSAGAAMAVTFTLKNAVNATRPNGESQSFPSSHATITVVSAEFLRIRYGWKYGLPAYFVASYVGYDRIRTNVHYPLDVAAGAVIAFVSANIFAKPYKGWAIQPVTGRNPGLRISRKF